MIIKVKFMPGIIMKNWADEYILDLPEDASLEILKKELRKYVPDDFSAFEWTTINYLVNGKQARKGMILQTFDDVNIMPPMGETQDNKNKFQLEYEKA